MMASRVVSGIVALLFALTITLLGGWVFAAAIGMIIFLGQLEFFRLVQAKGTAPAIKTTMVLSQVLVIFQHLKPEWIAPMFTVSGSVICFYLLFKPQVATIADVATSVLGFFYCAYLPSHWIVVRSLPEMEQSGQGLQVTLLAYGCIIAADVGAYALGQRFGKTRLSIISPKKTVEGALSGIGFSMAIAISGAWWLDWPLPGLTGGIIGCLIGLTSLLGDLTESLMKRDAGVKDSGQILPGHGGILDRGDSYVFTAPLVYYFMVILRAVQEYLLEAA